MKIFLYITISLTFATFLYAQAPNKNWEKVLELEDQIIFVDTTNIKQIESQISAIGLSIYKLSNPKLKTKVETYAVKTNVIFDTEVKKYTVVGNLYYDKQWKIIGETSSPGRSINSALFGSLIDTNKVMTAIYTKCSSYLSKKSSVEKPNQTNSVTKTLPNKDVQPVKQLRDTESVKDNREALTEKFIDKKLSEESKSITPNKPEQSQSTIKNISEVKNVKAYDNSTDRNVRGTIFSDGKKYSFQLSSWKNKSQAEAEVKRLISAGHNAFLVEAYLPNKGGTWYRVRIGYFDTAEDAEKYRRNMK